MTSDRSDPFERFAANHGLRMSAVGVVAAPRDVLAQPADGEWHTLVTLSSERGDAPPVQAVFVTEAADRQPPSLRDVLWWLSADSWAIEHAGRDVTGWAATYRYGQDHPATLRTFRLHLDQANALAALLGRDGYRALLSLYESEVSPTVEHAKPT